MVPARSDLQSDRSDCEQFNALTISAIHIHNLPAAHPPALCKGKPHQPLAPSSAMPHTAKTRPSGAKALIPNSSFLIPHSLIFVIPL